MQLFSQPKNGPHDLLASQNFYKAHFYMLIRLINVTNPPDDSKKHFFKIETFLD